MSAEDAKPATSSMSHEEKDKVIGELCGRIIFAVERMKPKGRATQVMDRKTGATQTWEDWFLDGLELAGFKVDRDAFNKAKKKKGLRR